MQTLSKTKQWARDQMGVATFLQMITHQPGAEKNIGCTWISARVYNHSSPLLVQCTLALHSHPRSVAQLPQPRSRLLMRLDPSGPCSVAWAATDCPLAPPSQVIGTTAPSKNSSISAKPQAGPCIV
jgi:hypothetical protein